MLSLCEPAGLASYLRRQEHVYRLMYHDGGLAEIIPSTALVEGFVCRHPSLGAPLSDRGPDAHEWQPCSVEVCYSHPVTILTSEGAALPHMSIPLRSDAFGGVVDSHLAQSQGLRFQVRPNVVTVLVPGVE